MEKENKTTLDSPDANDVRLRTKLKFEFWFVAIIIIAYFALDYIWR